MGGSMNMASSTGANNTGYFAYVNNGGKLTLGKYVGNATLRAGRQYFTRDADVGFTLEQGVAYTMSLTGIYSSANVINLTFSISDGISTYSLSAIPDVIYEGLNFGLINVQGSTPQQASSLLINYYDFSVFSAIPEPSTYVLLGLGASLLMFLRRRKV